VLSKFRLSIHAIPREKQLRKWQRAWKTRWMEQANAGWRDLYGAICAWTGFPLLRERGCDVEWRCGGQWRCDAIDPLREKHRRWMNRKDHIQVFEDPEKTGTEAVRCTDRPVPDSFG